MENKSQQGSSSAENTGRFRDDQISKSVHTGEKNRQDMTKEIGESQNHLAGLKDMGALSGGDDASGGSGDQMENENTGEETE